LDEHDVFQVNASNCLPQLFCQAEPDDLVHDLNLPKDTAEVLGSRHKAKNVITPGTNFSWPRHHEQELISYCSEYESIVYCMDISKLISLVKITTLLTGRCLLIFVNQVSTVSYSIMAMCLHLFSLNILST
jgi:hypothetical protein